MVPFDMGGLVARMGGPARARQRLDAFLGQFAHGPDAPYAWMGNEPSLGTPWAYDYAGAPWQTQAAVRRVMMQLYGDSPRGLPGNDDLGSMSSWYVWAALGLYALRPGSAGFVLGGPLFPQVTLTLGQRHIRITASGAAPNAPYVQALRLDGAPATRLWLPLATLAGADELTFTMGTAPNTSWGADPADTPPSLAGDRWTPPQSPPPHTR
jgi:putative alpha-1,2-mannosidase